MAVLPEDLRQQVEADFDSCAATLHGLLIGSETAADGKAGSKKLKHGVISLSVTDSSLKDALKNASPSTKISEIADMVASRVPADADGVDMLVERGGGRRGNELEKALRYIRICSSLGGRCSTSHERVASFAPFVAHMKNLVFESKIDLSCDTYEYNGLSGVGAFIKVIYTAIGSIYSMKIREDGPPSAYSLVQWSDMVLRLPSHLEAALACYNLLLALVRLKLSNTALDEDSIHDLVSSIQHMIHLTSPYTSLGLIASHAKYEQELTMEDLVLFLACNTKGLSCGREELKAPLYILYMSMARRAISFAKERNFVSLSSSMENSAADMMPPHSILDWLTSHPPSAIIQLLIEKSNRGLQEISQYITQSMKEKEVQALSSLSYSELVEGYHEPRADDADNMHPTDDLLFFKSTEGELSMLPAEWEDNGDDAQDPGSVDIVDDQDPDS